jgi:hypothetical protein
MDGTPRKISVLGDIQPELLQPAPRKVHSVLFATQDQLILLLSNLGIGCLLPLLYLADGLTWFHVFLVGLLSWSWYAFGKKWHLDKRLLHSGAVGRATITRKYCNGHMRYIEYEFVPSPPDDVVGAEPVRDEVLVSFLLSSVEWSRLEEGQEFTVLYAPAKPKLHTPYFASYFRAT